MACRDEPSCPWPYRLSMNTKRRATPSRYRYLQNGSPKPSGLWPGGSQPQWSVRSRRCGREAEAMPKSTVSGHARTLRVGTCPDRCPASSTSELGRFSPFATYPKHLRLRPRCGHGPLKSRRSGLSLRWNLHPGHGRRKPAATRAGCSIVRTPDYHGSAARGYGVE